MSADITNKDKGGSKRDSRCDHDSPHSPQLEKIPDSDCFASAIRPSRELSSDQGPAGRDSCKNRNSRRRNSTEDRTETSHVCKREKSASSFSHLLWGWETYVSEGAGNVQVRHKRDTFQPLQMLQNLSLCGASESFGVSRIAAPPSTERKSVDPTLRDDPFEAIVLRHSRSSPIHYSRMFDDDPFPPTGGLDRMRRSISSPASSAFKERIGCTSRLPNLGDQNDRSAFSLPIQQKRFHASFDTSRVHHSAFDPVPLTATVMDTSEATSIEVMDLPPRCESPAETDTEEPVNQLKAAPSRTARFLADVRVLRRRRDRRGGRENPATPPLSFPPCRTDKSRNSGTVGESVLGHQKSSYPTLAYMQVSCQGNTSREARRGRLSDTVASFMSNDTDDEDMVSPDSGLPDATAGHYHQLDSDVDEEYEHYQRIEASFHTESPVTVPSPGYHKFLDEQVDPPLRSDGQGSDAETLVPAVRIQVSTVMKPPQNSVEDHRGVSEDAGTSHPGLTLRRERDRNSLTPTSHDSGTQSAGTIRSTITNYTSGHTTQATSTSATVSSGQITVLSSVNEEADREVMETNQAGKLRRQRHPTMEARGRDGNGSMHSSSTATTHSHGYLSLAGSPAPLREGACLPIERFFCQSAIQHSSTRASYSSKGRGARISGIVNDTRSGGELWAPSRLANLQQKKHGGPESPATVSSASVGNTTSSISTGEEPPKFVSYLDRKLSSDPTMPDTRFTTVACPGDDADFAKRRESPTKIMGYSEIVFEESRALDGPLSTQPQPIRPLRKRIADKGKFSKLSCRPPRSPIKLGSRTPTTPPPASASGRPDSISPAYQQLSPPRNIIDPNNPYTMRPRKNSDLSRPHVFRSTSRTSSDPSRKLVIVTPEACVTEACQAPHQRVTLSSPLPGSLAHIVREGANFGTQEVNSAPFSFPARVSQESNLTYQEGVGTSTSACFPASQGHIQ